MSFKNVRGGWRRLVSMRAVKTLKRLKICRHENRWDLRVHWNQFQSKNFKAEIKIIHTAATEANRHRLAVCWHKRFKIAFSSHVKNYFLFHRRWIFVGNLNNVKRPKNVSEKGEKCWFALKRVPATLNAFNLSFKWIWPRFNQLGMLRDEKSFFMIKIWEISEEKVSRKLWWMLGDLDSQVKRFRCMRNSMETFEKSFSSNAGLRWVTKEIVSKGKFPFLEARIIEILQLFNWSKCNKHANDKWNWYDKRPRNCLDTFLSLAGDAWECSCELLLKSSSRQFLGVELWRH